MSQVDDLQEHVGKELGVGDWHVVTQEEINLFADATGDHQWIHVDVEKAKKEMPDGKTIAHGYLTLSLIPLFSHDILKIRKVSRGLNYGCNKVRFTNTVPAGSKLRARQTLLAADPMPGNGVRMTYQWTIEREGADKPACIAETMSIAYA